MGYDVNGELVWRTPADDEVAARVRAIVQDEVVCDGCASDAADDGCEYAGGELWRSHEEGLARLADLHVAYLLTWIGEDGISGWEAWDQTGGGYRSGAATGEGADVVLCDQLAKALDAEDPLVAVRQLLDEARHPNIAAAAPCALTLAEAEALLDGEQVEA